MTDVPDAAVQIARGVVSSAGRPTSPTVGQATLTDRAVGLVIDDYVQMALRNPAVTVVPSSDSAYRV